MGQNETFKFITEKATTLLRLFRKEKITSIHITCSLFFFFLFIIWCNLVYISNLP